MMNKLLLLFVSLCFVACGNTSETGGDSAIIRGNTNSVNQNNAQTNTQAGTRSTVTVPDITTELVLKDGSSAIKTERMNKVKAGKKLTSAKYTDQSGIDRLFEGMRGKTVILDLWATWCTPCIDAMPSFDKLAEDLSSNKDLVFMKLSVDEDKKGWESYVREKKHDQNSTWIGRDEDNPLFWLTYKNINYEGQDAVLESLPRYVIIGPDGTVLDNDAPSPVGGKLLATINSLSI